MTKNKHETTISDSLEGGDPVQVIDITLDSRLRDASLRGNDGALFCFKKKPSIFLFLIFVSLISVGCQTLKPLTPLPNEQAEELRKKCAFPFSDSAIRAVHKIEASLPLDNNSSMMGVTISAPKHDKIRAVLMSVEGLVLFDGVNSFGKTKTYKALPPLDDPAFAEGLFADIRLMYFFPTKSTPFLGRTNDMVETCRYTKNGTTIDIEPHINSVFFIRQYRNDKIEKSVEIDFLDKDEIFSEKIKLKSFGMFDYSLEFELLDVEAVEFSEELFSP